MPAFPGGGATVIPLAPGSRTGYAAVMGHKIHTLALPGPLLVEVLALEDPRGWFQEAWNPPLLKTLGIRALVQSNQSFSKKGVLRGLHYQTPPHAQGKLIQVLEGKSWHVAVDIRPESPHFGGFVAQELSPGAGLLWIPEGFAHGFLALEPVRIQYHCTRPWHPQSEAGLYWADPSLGIPWPLAGAEPLVSPRDCGLSGLEVLRVSGNSSRPDRSGPGPAGPPTHSVP